MATNSIILPLGLFIPHTGSPQPLWTTTNRRRYIAFDSSSAEYIVASGLIMPPDFGSALITEVQWSASGASAPGASVDTVEWSSQIMAVTPGDAVSMLTESFATANTQSDEADNTTARALMTVDIAMSNDDGVQAGDNFALIFGRTAAASTKLAEDAWLWGLRLKYTTA